jgi:hypothetical protein
MHINSKRDLIAFNTIGFPKLYRFLTDPVLGRVYGSGDLFGVCVCEEQFSVSDRTQQVRKE